MSAEPNQPFDPENDRRGPGVKVPPPVMVLGSILLGYCLQKVTALTLLTGLFWPGLCLVVIAAGLALGCLWLFFRARTHVEPWQPTSRIIVSGVYRFSRNPIYLAFCVLQMGIALMLANGWILLTCCLTYWLLSRFVISREEAYLEAKFGAEYLEYKQRVRRWL